MCLAIWKPAGKTIKKEHLENGFASNNHGAGIAFANKGKLTIKKGFFKFEEFYAEYEKVQALPCLIHFRIRTSGGQDARNCHPWEVTPHLALIHNGILRLQEQNGLSDTGVFATYILRPIVEAGPGNWQRPGIKWLLEEAIGTSNKMVLMNGDGEHVILNEKQGDWDNGCWFSNSTWKWKSHRGGGHYYRGDYDYSNRDAYGVSVRGGGSSRPDPRWQETNIPNVFLLSREHVDKWGKPATEAKTTSVSASSASRSAKASTSEVEVDEMVAAEIQRLKDDGWVEWTPELQPQ